MEIKFDFFQKIIIAIKKPTKKENWTNKKLLLSEVIF